MGYIKCSRNQRASCCNNPTPLNRDSSESGWWSCDEGECSYVFELNVAKTTELNTQAIQNALYADNGRSILDLIDDLQQNIGGDSENGDSIGEMIYSIRANIGSIGVEDETIGQLLFSIRDNFATISSQLSGLRNDLGANGNNDRTIGQILVALETASNLINNSVGECSIELSAINTNTSRY